jgi:hypothetical protein
MAVLASWLVTVLVIEMVNVYGFTDRSPGYVLASSQMAVLVILAAYRAKE